MQRIEADAVGAKLARELDQVLQIGEIAHAPVARRTHAVELHGDEPRAIEIPGKGLRRHDQRHVLARGSGIRETEAVCARRQGLRPMDGATIRLALPDHPVSCHDGPAGGQPGRWRQLGLRGLAEPNHHRSVDEMAIGARRQRIDDDFQRGLVGHAGLALAIDELGENSEILGLAIQVHSARGLHDAGARYGKFGRQGKRIDVLTPVPRQPFPRGTFGARAAFYKTPERPRGLREEARRFHVNGITMNKKIQTFGSAGCGVIHVLRSSAPNRMP